MMRRFMFAAMCAAVMASAAPALAQSGVRVQHLLWPQQAADLLRAIRFRHRVPPLCQCDVM